MFCNKPKSVNRNVPSKKNRKRKKKLTHPQSDIKERYKKQSPLNIAKAMSTWAQNYTAASTWQLKHQVAYWKSRAVALQYENKVLHEMIREQYFNHTATGAAVDSSESGEETEISDEEEEENNKEDTEIGEEAENGEEAECDDIDNEEDKEVGHVDNEDLEVSEEFIEFLKQNAKYKEIAKKEKARLKAREKAEKLETILHEQMLESSEVKIAMLKELYGCNWEKIMALETMLLCEFISESDKHQPEYWPNIPFNL